MNYFNNGCLALLSVLLMTEFSYPLMPTTQQTPPEGEYPEATFVVFGPYRTDRVTFTLDRIVGEDAAIGAVQLFEWTPAVEAKQP